MADFGQTKARGVQMGKQAMEKFREIIQSLEVIESDVKKAGALSSVRPSLIDGVCQHIRRAMETVDVCVESEIEIQREDPEGNEAA